MLYNRDVLKAAAIAVSTDGTRPALCGVHLDGKRAIGCDGNVLIAIDSGGFPFEEFPHVEGFIPADKPLTLPAKALLDAVKATPRNGMLPVLHCVAIGKEPGDGADPKARIVATDLDVTHNATVRDLGQYPDWEKVMPTGEPKVKLALTVDVVLKLFKALKAAGLQHVNVDIVSELAAIKVTGQADGRRNVLAMLMPAIRTEAEYTAETV